MTQKTKQSNQKKFAVWFRIITIILICFGLLYTVFGLKIFSESNTLFNNHGLPLIPQNVLLPWESALYGAIMIGWGVTLWLIGRVAFKRDDSELKRALIIGLAAWLIVEAIASAYLGIWFNVGVDIVVFILFALPLSR